MNLEEIKEFLNVYHDLEDKYIELLKQVVIEEMKEVIPNFKEDDMTSRQKLLLLMNIGELYDNREIYEKNSKKMKSNISAMLLNEMYKGD